jgi:hypothetical protein
MCCLFLLSEKMVLTPTHRTGTVRMAQFNYKFDEVLLILLALVSLNEIVIKQSLC